MPLILDYRAALEHLLRVAMDLSHLTGVSMNAIDLSYGDLHKVPPASLPPLVIQCLWTGADRPYYAIDNLIYAHANGRKIASYIALASTRDAAWHFQQGRQGIPDELWQDQVFCATDVELSALTSVDIDQMLGLIGDPRIIYTRRGFWEWQPYRDYPFRAWLWDARYAFNGVVPLFAPYGLWQKETQLLGVQTEGTHSLHGCDVDSNVFDLARLAKSEEDEMKSYLAWDLDRQRAYLISPMGVAWITQGSDLNTLAAIYGPMTIALHASTIDSIGRSSKVLPSP